MTLYEAIERFSADGMRLTLADAGDGTEDANFSVDSADGGIKRLYTLIEWCTDIMADIQKGELRSPDKHIFADSIFANQMNNLINLAKDNYEKTLYHEAVINSFFEFTVRVSFFKAFFCSSIFFQKARDFYREMCGTEKMRSDLVKTYLENQALILSPICPHIAETVWSIIGKQTLIVTELWPVPGEVDHIILDTAEFFEKAVHAFRIRLKEHLDPKKKKVAPTVPTKATIMYANNYPGWQKEILTLLKKIHDENNGEFIDNKQLSKMVMAIPEVKPNAKNAMPFVQYIKDNVSRTGVQALNLAYTIDQGKVLMDMMEYLKNTLNVEDVSVECVDGTTDEKISSRVNPGTPFITFA